MLIFGFLVIFTINNFLFSQDSNECNTYGNVTSMPMENDGWYYDGAEDIIVDNIKVGRRYDYYNQETREVETLYYLKNKNKDLFLIEYASSYGNSLFGQSFFFYKFSEEWMVVSDASIINEVWTLKRDDSKNCLKLCITLSVNKVCITKKGRKECYNDIYYKEFNLSLD